MESISANILIVDDDQSNRILLEKMVTALGHRQAQASNGNEALALMRAACYDAVLLDIMMPEMDGYEVLKRVKSDSSLRHIPVIVISSVESIDSIARCIQMGAEDYLAKPFNRILLQARLDACLERKRLHDKEQQYLRQIEAEHRKSDSLLRVIFPEAVVEELKATQSVKPRRYENVAVMFCDVVGFTEYCERHQPEDIISHLQQLVSVFEELSLEYGLEEIKTIGDSFMSTAGLLAPLENPVLACVQCALAMVAVTPMLPANWNVRVGIHVGPVVAGVLGNRKYLFDLWGDTVNTAARVEAFGVPNAVNVSKKGWEAISQHCDASTRDVVNVPGKGLLQLYQVKSLHEKHVS